MVNNSTYIIKTNNHMSPSLTEYKQKKIFRQILNKSLWVHYIPSTTTTLKKIHDFVFS